MRLAMVIVVLAGAVLVGACDSEETESAPVDGCAALARALCGGFAECAPAAIELTYGTEDACTTRVTLDCAAQRDAPGSGLGEDFLSECASAIDGCEALRGRPPEVCKTPPGALSPGAPCSFDAQCIGGRCIRDQASTCGVCGARVPAGGSCVGDASACEAGSACAFADTCVLVGDEGEACDVDAPCGQLLVCSEGTCAVGGGAGDACDETRPCSTGSQVWCGGSGTCEPFSMVEAGQACGLVNEQLVLCANGGECDGDPEGTCVAPGGDGQACGGVDGDLCTTPAVCASDACAVPTGSCG